MPDSEKGLNRILGRAKSLSFDRLTDARLVAKHTIQTTSNVVKAANTLPCDSQIQGKNQVMQARVEAIKDGLISGEKNKFLFAVPFEGNWDKKIDLDQAYQEVEKSFSFFHPISPDKIMSEGDFKQGYAKAQYFYAKIFGSPFE